MELDFDRCFHFHRLAVQNIRFVLPLLYCIHRSLNENWMPTYAVEVFDDSGLTYGRLQDDISLNVGDPGHLRICWRHVMDLEAFGDTGGDAQFLRRGYLGGRRG